MEPYKAVIFDMDGVIIDNNKIHVKAWEIFCKKYSLAKIENYNHFFGRSNRDILPEIFNRSMTTTELKTFAAEKEAIYREIYAPKIKPINGLIDLLKLLKDNGVKLAVATSAMRLNLDFVLERLQIKEFFDLTVCEDDVQHAKPDPEIYLLTAKKLNVQPDECLVFEDSISGVNSGINAGMKVIGLTTTHTHVELFGTIFCVKDYKELLELDVL